MQDDSTEATDDEATFSMFGAGEMGSQPDEGYQVLARKYRPRLFSDLIGQEAMVRTLGNAFRTGRVAHAFMLTGVRGVGKTTTARLLARALNYTRPEHDAPSLELDPPGSFCPAIMAGHHPDVLELDAASRPGVSDMRELLDSARYAPAASRYKVYIIDEVHMLSLASFNALLKTLEEPPGHVKFIFATTEIRKVPITVLSRCQRFDLKRLDTQMLAGHLGKIAEAEGAQVSQEGLDLLARAAEGSVRDGLSILDQAIVQAPEGGQVTGEKIREMLGLGDRLRLLDGFELALKGDAKACLDEVLDQMRAGADPLILLKDMLEIAADIATVQAAGPNYRLPGPEDWTHRTHELAGLLSPAQAQRNWKILLTGYKDMQLAPDAETALRMTLLRLVAAAGLPSPEEAARHLQGGATGALGKRQAAAPDAAARASKSSNVVPLSRHADRPLNTFDGFLARLDEVREVRLWGEARKYVRVDNFLPGKLICAVDSAAPPDLLRRISDFLALDTGMDWQIEVSESQSLTVREQQDLELQNRLQAAREHPMVQAVLDAIPGSEITDIHAAKPALKSGQTEDDVALTRQTP